MIHVSHLSKSFGSLKAVKDLSFSVSKGRIFAFLGTNGAGKSTTISCLTTMSSADSGTIKIAGLTVGRDDDQIRRKIGVVFQASLLDPSLTVRENLADRAAFYAMRRVDRARRIAELADMIDLGDFLDRPYGLLSGGQKRRVDIARALIHEPVLLFLDEPTAGLDPQSREQVWETIRSLRSTHGMTVFLTTHYMEETEEADQISIIHAGELVVQGTPADLRKTYSSSILSVTSDDVEQLHEACASHGFAVTRAAGAARIAVGGSAEAFKFLHDNRLIVDDFEFRHGTMDDVFLSVTANRATA
ncbi:ABC transporter ATP-binding protein [Cryobacterium sp. Y57]|uniref:ABC transporter ATP-binding protein n=1 Tax=Cryobacterium sp. Y57 TaxID=2048287 RepID=UPI001E3DF471|nr:ABC transporter ATP-binding protein [Cryobacterium sp. Y57]